MRVRCRASRAPATLLRVRRPQCMATCERSRLRTAKHSRSGRRRKAAAALPRPVAVRINSAGIRTPLEPLVINAITILAPWACAAASTSNGGPSQHTRKAILLRAVAKRQQLHHLQLGHGQPAETTEQSAELSCSARPYREMRMLMAARRQRRDGQACAAWPNPPAKLSSFL